MGDDNMNNGKEVITGSDYPIDGGFIKLNN